jgi:hypothetical protein
MRRSTVTDQTKRPRWLRTFGTRERPKAVDGHALWAGPDAWFSIGALAPRRPRLVLLCPKAVPTEWWFTVDLQRDVALVQASYPADRRLSAFLRVVAGPGTAIVFVGDMDPVAIAQYLAARSMLAASDGQHLLYGGMNDAWLAAMRASSKPRQTALRIRLDRDEERLLRHLESAVDLAELLGPSGAALLRSGYKIELEAGLNPTLHGSAVKRWVVRYVRLLAARRRLAARHRLRVVRLRS